MHLNCIHMSNTRDACTCGLLVSKFLCSACNLRYKHMDSKVSCHAHIWYRYMTQVNKVLEQVTSLVRKVHTWTWGKFYLFVSQKRVLQKSFLRARITRRFKNISNKLFKSDFSNMYFVNLCVNLKSDFWKIISRLQ